MRQEEKKIISTQTIFRHPFKMRKNILFSTKFYLSLIFSLFSLSIDSQEKRENDVDVECSETKTQKNETHTTCTHNNKRKKRKTLDATLINERRSCAKRK